MNINTLKMRNEFLNLVAGIGVLCGVSLAAAKSSAIVEPNNEYIVIEAESAQELGKWVVHTDNSKYEWIEGFSGEGCIQFTGNRENSGPPDSPLTYRFKVEEHGIYRLEARALEAPIETNEGDKANDCYLRLIGAPEYKGEFSKFYLAGDSYQWSWSVKLELGHGHFEHPVYTLKEGVHQIQIAGRSKNFFLDRIVLYRLDDNEEAKDLSLEPVVLADTKSEDAYVFNAVEDFEAVTVPELGTVYVDKWRNVLGVNAGDVSLRDIFSPAAMTFEGESGIYDLELKTMTEIDGESFYRLMINGEQFGRIYKNPESIIDYSPSFYKWRSVRIKKGDTIRIDSMPATNGKIPEGDETAWARGRWVEITLTRED